MDATPDTPKKTSKGRKPTLTMAIAVELERHWMTTNETILTDEEICTRVGITSGQLRGWLQRNRRPVREDGVPGGDGLRAIRERARSNLKLSYLANLRAIANDAKAAGDFKTAANVEQRMASKQFPVQFGDRQRVDIGKAEEKQTGVAVVPAVMTDEEWEKAHPPIGITTKG